MNSDLNLTENYETPENQEVFKQQNIVTAALEKTD